MSQEEELAANDFNDGLNFDGKNYEVRLPWKREHPKLENNYGQAVKRLESIERKLKRDPEKAEAYTTAINQYVERGFAEEVLDLTIGDVSVRYLPHHAVFRADRQTTKCRINSRSLLDVILVSDPVLVKSSGVLEITISDHFLVHMEGDMGGF